MNDNIAGLRERLSRLEGTARVPTLMSLGHELFQRYWRIGPGHPAALGDLSAAIDAWHEAYYLLDPDDPGRGEVAIRLGWLLAARYGMHGSGSEDRETGMLLLSEALSTDLSPVLAPTARFWLGNLRLMRAIESLTPAHARAGYLTGPPDGVPDDIGAAIRLFREVHDGPPVSDDLTTGVHNLLRLAESLRLLIRGDLARFDIAPFMQMRSELQRLQRNGLPPTSWLPVDPLDYPVTVMRGDEHQTSTVPPRRPAATAGTRTMDACTAVGPSELGSARRAVRDRLAALVADRELPAWEQARTLLLVDPSGFAAGDLDAFVGAAVNAVDAGRDDVDEGDEPVEAGLDRLLSSIGLWLRKRRDGNGWAADDEDPIGGGYRTAAERLLTATTLIPPDHPAASVVVEATGGLLDESRPLSGVIADIADRVFEYAERIASGPPVVTALAELCRTVAALRTGGAIDPDGLATAVAELPSGHPLRRALATAVDHARLAAAVRVGEPITVDPTLGDLAGLLDALLRDDRAALRKALDAVAGQNSPQLSAIRGAVLVRLASELSTAIALLSHATRTLRDGGLRTRTWWRLAEAYRARGATGDAESSRQAGRNALRGADPARPDAARFAGWMLAEGHAMEAFTALEVAAASPDPPAADPLAWDVLSALIGLAPPVGAPPEPPGPASVAAAVRDLGAAALLYLHPTDEVGRTAGVLCLDPVTDRLDVLANVPVTDPLTSDDPGWPAVLGRWTSEHLLVAATGGLDRLALPAMRTGDGRYLVQDVVVSRVSSGTQVMRLAARSIPQVDTEPMFVVNPRGDRDPEMTEVMTVRRMFYPRSVCLGRALEPVDAAGTADDVLARTPTASLVHFACGLRGTKFQLAGGGLLDAAAIPGSGCLAILTEGLAPALLDAGFGGVVGWQWAVPTPFAALALFLVHLQLVEDRLPPAAAVNAVQRWMLDPGRVLPPLLTRGHLNTVATTDLTQPALWAALAYFGR